MRESHFEVVVVQSNVNTIRAGARNRWLVAIRVVVCTGSPKSSAWHPRLIPTDCGLPGCQTLLLLVTLKIIFSDIEDNAQLNSDVVLV